MVKKCLTVAPVLLDASPIRVGETTGFEKTGTRLIEFMIVGVARDMNKQHDMLATAPQHMRGRGRDGRFE